MTMIRMHWRHCHQGSVEKIMDSNDVIDLVFCRICWDYERIEKDYTKEERRILTNEGSMLIMPRLRRYTRRL